MDEIAIDPDGVVDIVPIDYVGAGVLALLRDPRASGTVALVAGESAPSNAELIELASRQFGREPPRIVATPASRLADADLYVPYFGIEASLDDTRARELLVPHGLVGAAAARLLRHADRLRRARALGQGHDHPPGRGRRGRLTRTIRA